MSLPAPYRPGCNSLRRMIDIPFQWPFEKLKWGIYNLSALSAQHAAPVFPCSKAPLTAPWFLLLSAGSSCQAAIPPMEEVKAFNEEVAACERFMGSERFTETKRSYQAKVGSSPHLEPLIAHPERDLDTSTCGYRMTTLLRTWWCCVRR